MKRFTEKCAGRLLKLIFFSEIDGTVTRAPFSDKSCHRISEKYFPELNIFRYHFERYFVSLKFCANNSGCVTFHENLEENVCDGNRWMGNDFGEI